MLIEVYATNSNVKKRSKREKHRFQRERERERERENLRCFLGKTFRNKGPHSLHLGGLCGAPFGAQAFNTEPLAASTYISVGNIRSFCTPVGASCIACLSPSEFHELLIGSSSYKNV